jgi:hypothetical protein
MIPPCRRPDRPAGASAVRPAALPTVDPAVRLSTGGSRSAAPRAKVSSIFVEIEETLIGQRPSTGATVSGGHDGVWILRPSIALGANGVVTCRRSWHQSAEQPAPT